jgi:RNA polymerase sigma-70 factor (ECF subfamily)
VVDALLACSDQEIPSRRSTRGTLNASYPRAARGGPLDEDTIREFLATDYGRLVAGVALMCGSRPAAEDAVQEALARAWERSERGEQIRSLKAWVTRVAINLVRSGFRRARAERRARERLGARQVAGQASPGMSPGPPDEAADLRRALSALPRRQREATVLRYYLDMDVKEIATALGVNEGTAKTTLFRARHALADALGEREVEEANDVGRH